MSGDADANTIGPHESRGASVIAAAVVSLLMSFVFLVMRFISRAVVIKDLGWSDWTVAMGWVRIPSALAVAKSQLMPRCCRQTLTALPSFSH